MIALIMPRVKALMPKKLSNIHLIDLHYRKRLFFNVIINRKGNGIPASVRQKR